METRLLGQTGLRVSVLSLGTMTFGGQNRFAHMGTLGVEQATEMVDRCLDAGVNLFDTADIYSNGIAEEVLGAAIGKRRDDVLIATKLNARISDDPNDLGQSRHHIVRACEASLRRLGTDWIDLYRSTASTSSPHSRNPSAPSTTSSAKAKSATSAPATSRPGTS